MDFVMISPGSVKRFDDGGEQVVVSKAFFLQTTKVTQAQWLAVMSTSLEDLISKAGQPWVRNVGKGASFPIYSVSWTDADEFCQKLSDRSRKTIRLPTLMEWEYAARAGESGRSSPPSRRSEDVEWQDRADLGAVHPVASKRPSAWGLYDMLSNVQEWCSDRGPRGLSGDTYVIKGGGILEAMPMWDWWSSANKAARQIDVGFRVVMEGP
jgi:formylglycine-generating enzyme required for sulfatase activity